MQPLHDDLWVALERQLVDNDLSASRRDTPNSAWDIRLAVEDALVAVFARHEGPQRRLTELNLPECPAQLAGEDVVANKLRCIGVVALGSSARAQIFGRDVVQCYGAALDRWARAQHLLVREWHARRTGGLKLVLGTLALDARIG